MPAGNPNWRKGSNGKGASGNPGGLTAEERAARDAMRKWLSGRDMQERAKTAYSNLLDEGNPVIVKDAMERLAGKVREHLEVTGEDGAPLLPPLTGAQLTAYIDELRAARLERERKK